MALKDPAHYRDKTGDWLEAFSSARKAELRKIATTDVLDEHANDPRGLESDHSPELLEVLNFARGLPIEHKVFVHATRPHEEYRLSTLVARGQRASERGSTRYGSEREAVHAALLERLHEQGVVDEEQMNR